MLAKINAMPGMSPIKRRMAIKASIGWFNTGGVPVGWGMKLAISSKAAGTTIAKDWAGLVKRALTPKNAASLLTPVFNSS